ncbi:hypothetical protein [Paragemmobacter straminiformis]|uniref:Uncharacterized protein n=1 Tax=Paragemmobacter straminiformis TaxID=2045119 RepID=A0A842I9T6_9RHOB|nr:hypothetical protein [Gemmobacter straminiformis]MBC2836117.1 hypothetical protein [Gemmobacter straminiformis]
MTHSETLAETMLVQREARRSKLRAWVVAFILGMAVALALAVTTAPARADDRDLARALAAIAIVGIIATAAKDRDRPRQEQHPHYTPRQSRAPRVPAVCGIEISGRSTRATVYGERCLREEGFDWRLPQHCARPARIYGQNDRIYTEQCLRDAGFRIGGHRN